jgi:GNAT superfamily N-acetyltransferase
MVWSEEIWIWRNSDKLGRLGVRVPGRVGLYNHCRNVSLRARHISVTKPSKPLCIAIKDEHGNIVGGLWGHTACGWLFTELLVVPQESRGAGLGTQLMSMAEAEAVQRGCHSAWLDTHEFQAKGFYEKLGYTEFGRLENFPTGYARHFFQKKLLSTT